ncbi:hypothetical protein [Myxococcus sp. Y35]
MQRSPRARHEREQVVVPMPEVGRDYEPYSGGPGQSQGDSTLEVRS